MVAFYSRRVLWGWCCSGDAGEPVSTLECAKGLSSVGQECGGEDGTEAGHALQYFGVSVVVQSDGDGLVKMRRSASALEARVVAYSCSLSTAFEAPAALLTQPRFFNHAASWQKPVWRSPEGVW